MYRRFYRIAFVGIGSNIVSVTDMEQSVSCSNRFLQRVFCPAEQEYCEKQSNKFRHYAGLLAVKEAVLKALGTGRMYGSQWKHIEVIRNHSGNPEVLLHDVAKEYAEQLRVKSINISLSQTEQYATAVVSLEF